MVAYLPIILGRVVLLACGCVCLYGTVSLVLEDAGAHGSDAQLPVIIVLVTVASMIMYHRAHRWGKLPFAVVAALGSMCVIYSGMGRIADATEQRTSANLATTLKYQEYENQLKEAKAEAKQECHRQGTECNKRRAHVVSLTEKMTGLAPVALNPKVDAAAGFIALLTRADETWLREVISKFEKLLAPLLLDLGAGAFLASACKPIPRQLTTLAPAKVSTSYTQEEAWQDFMRLRTSGSDTFLAERWNVEAPTVSKWMRKWREQERIERQRDGKQMVTVLIPQARDSRAV